MTEPSLATDYSSCATDEAGVALRGAAIANMVDPTAELDLLDSLAKEAGIDIDIPVEVKPGGEYLQ